MSTNTLPVARTKETKPMAKKPAQRRKPTARQGGFGSKLTVNGLLVLGSLYMVVPVLWLLFASTKNAADLYGTSA